VGQSGRRNLDNDRKHQDWKAVSMCEQVRLDLGRGITEKVIWCMVRECASKANLEQLAPHDLRRTCARLCHEAGGELEQIQFLLGHISVQTRERYLGCKQQLREVVNDKIGLEPLRDGPAG
jgi:site-specific recombinase XerD